MDTRNRGFARKTRTRWTRMVGTFAAAMVAASMLPLATPAGATHGGFANGKIAFASDSDGDFDIFTLNADGTLRSNLTAAGSFDDKQPVWSPDGSKIAFASNRGGNMDIYVMSSYGSGVTRITDSPASDTQPSWSADGTQLAFTSTRVGGTKQIFVKSA